MCRIYRAALLAALALTMEAVPALATPFPDFYQSPRAVGMGGAYAAVADDAGALIYNPAGLTEVDGFNADMVNLEGEVSRNAPALVDDLQTAAGGTETAAADLIRAHIGEHIRMRGTTFPVVVTPRFGVGLIYQGTLDADLRNPVSPYVAVDARVESGILGAMAIKRGTTSIGVGGKLVRREGVARDYTALDIVSTQFDPVGDVGNPETDFAFDVGLTLRPDLPFGPRFAIVAKNLTDLDFGPLGTVPYQFNLGIAIQPMLGPFAVTFSGDLNDVTGNLGTDRDWKKRTNLGSEVRLRKFLAVRAGYHQGYAAAGATLDLWVVRLDLAVYTEELGAYGGQRGDRRYLAKLNFF
ncbi:MAG: hypothetical protein OEY97_00940 [Nitrospirota bacterium]|nr:hypothetical protein [Nitrospirota bacterium]